MAITWGEFKRIINEMHWSDESLVRLVEAKLDGDGPLRVAYSKTMGTEFQPHEIYISQERGHG